jgi:hypothetical protein
MPRELPVNLGHDVAAVMARARDQRIEPGDAVDTDIGCRHARSRKRGRRTTASYVPTLKSRILSSGIWRVPTASMIATIAGLFAQTPPSISRSWSTARQAGK